MVRSAAMDLVGKHVARDADVAEHYYDVVVERVADVGVSVRKRVINALHDLLRQRPFEFRRPIQALRHLAFRVMDDDPGVRDLVVRIFRELWFSKPPAGQKNDPGGVLDRRAAGGERGQGVGLGVEGVDLARAGPVARAKGSGAQARGDLVLALRRIVAVLAADLEERGVAQALVGRPRRGGTCRNRKRGGNRLARRTTSPHRGNYWHQRQIDNHRTYWPLLKRGGNGCCGWRQYWPGGLFT